MQGWIPKSKVGIIRKWAKVNKKEKEVKELMMGIVREWVYETVDKSLMRTFPSKLLCQNLPDSTSRQVSQPSRPGSVSMQTA